MSNLQPNCCLKFDFQKVDQHAGGKWLIHDTKRRKDNQLQFPHSAFASGPRSPALEEGMRAAMGATRECCAGPYA